MFARLFTSIFSRNRPAPARRSGGEARVSGGVALAEVAPVASIDPDAELASLGGTECAQREAADLHRAANARLEAALHAAFWQRRERLLAEVPTAASHKDVRRFLDALGQSFDILIRQPPLAAQEVLVATRDEDASTTAIVTLIDKDPALSQSVLRHANSAFYRTSSGPCAAVRDGVRRIGAEGVKSVMLNAMIEGLLCRPGAGYLEMLQRVWAHMVRTAPLARHVAPAFDVRPEQAYTLGLLHDVGKLVLFDRLAVLRAGLRRDVRLPGDLMHAILQQLHEPLGAVAILQWGLGEVPASAIAEHHRDPVPPGRRSLSEVIYLAERVDVAMARGRDVDVDALFAAGGLTGDAAAARSLLDGYQPAA